MICGCAHFSDNGAEVGKLLPDNDDTSEVTSYVSGYFSDLPDWATFYEPKPSSKVSVELTEDDCSIENIEKSEGRDNGEVCVQKNVRVRD